MFAWLFGRNNKKRVVERRQIAARYDAASDGDDLSKWWAAADDLSANEANSIFVRNKLRRRARYEYANNSYCQGIILTLANDLVGTGPRLQIRTGVPGVDDEIEASWSVWSYATNLPEVLHVLTVAKVRDGEAFGLLVTDRDRLDSKFASLVVVPIECDMITTPISAMRPSQLVDGIVVDSLLRPVEYHLLEEHPGGTVASGKFRVIPANTIVHWFRPDRPGQLRGVPEITPALPLFAMLRRYTLAVVSSAEMAASVSGVLQSDGPPGEPPPDLEAFDKIPYTRNTLMTIPFGWRIQQFEARQPQQSYMEFKISLLTEIARCLSIPANIALGDSSRYNYASGRLDHQIYRKMIAVERNRLERRVLWPIFQAWFEEMSVLGGVFSRVRLGEFTIDWVWDGHEHVDPVKEAAAQQIRLSMHTTTLAEEYAKQGKDWGEALAQRARELAMMRELGLPIQVAPTQPWPVGTFETD